jgi:hypothetical protein
LRASFARRMLQYVPAPPANGSFSAAAGTSVTGTLVGVGIGGTAPVWNSTPSLSVTATQSGFAGFSFTGTPTSVTVEPGDTLPGWVSAITIAGISWGTAATAGATFSFRLRATNAFGYSASSTISGTVAAAPPATGFFAGYTLQGKYSLTDQPRDDNQGVAKATKQVRWLEHPNRRAYFFGGDVVDTGTQQQWSVDTSKWVEGNRPAAWKLEHPKWPADGNVYPIHHDCTAGAWDSKRRVFWQIGGYNAGTGTDAPANKIAVYGKVMSFDPAKPVGTQWTNTGVDYQRGPREDYGWAVYDPTLDVVLSAIPGGTASYYPYADGYFRVQVWDCTTQTFRGNIVIKKPDLYVDQDGKHGHMVGIDPIERTLWVMMANGNQGFSSDKHIYKVTLPSTLAGWPAAPTGFATDVDLTASAIKVWSNTGGHDVGYGGPFSYGPDRKLYLWKNGPKGNDSLSPGMDVGLAYYGNAGRPLTSNGNYGSLNTALLIDLRTGVEEWAQFPLPTFTDNVGWIIPLITHFDGVSGNFWYGTCAFEWNSVENLKIENFMYVHRRKPLPSWVGGASLNQWVVVPNSNCSTDLPTDIRNVWSGPEASGYSECMLSTAKNPWAFSGISFRRRDSMVLIHGGGGLDGNGNGVLALSLNADTPTWSLPMPPTPKSKVQDENGTRIDTEFNVLRSDRNTQSTPKSPVAVHSYAQCHFIDDEDLWLRVGSNMVWPTDGGNYNGVHGFYWSEAAKPYSARTWSCNVRPSVPTTGGADRYFVQNPWTGDIIGGSTGQAALFARATNSWSPLIDLQNTGLRITAVDPLNNVALVHGRPDQGVWPRLVDLATRQVIVGNASSYIGPAVDSGEWSLQTGSTIYEAGYGTSLQVWPWDDDNQCLWALKAVGESGWNAAAFSTFDLFKITLVNKAACQWRVEKVTIGGTTRPSFTGLANQFFNKLKYVPELGGLVLSLGYNQPHYFIRTAARA